MTIDFFKKHMILAVSVSNIEFWLNSSKKRRSIASEKKLV
jgi:hypothetical protein